MNKPTKDQRSNLSSRPVQPKNRLVVVDVLRGFALFGILFVNIFSMSGLPYRGPFPDSLSQVLMNLIEFLVEAKFYHLFSFLFGWGIAIQLLRSRERGQPFLGRFIRRLVILFVIGTLHSALLWNGDILADYAFFGLLLALFFWMPSPLILVLAILMIGLAVLRGAPVEFIETFNANRDAFIAGFNIHIGAQPAFGVNYLADIAYRARVFLLEVLNYLWLPYYFFSVFGMFLLGLYVGKRKIFEHVDRHTRLLKVTMIVGLIIGVVGNYFHAYGVPAFVPAEYVQFAQFTSRTLGAPSLMLFYVCGLTLLFERTRLKERLLPLANVGRMALTNYLSHSLAAIIVFQAFGLYRQLSLPVALLYITILYFAQIRLSAWWLENHPFGPMEWLWRTLTYGRLQPWKKVHTLDKNDSPLPYWLQTINDRWNRLSPKVRLGAFGVVLLAWTSGLVIWQSQVSPRQGTFYQQLVERLESGEGEAPGDAQDGEDEADSEEDVPAAIATPQVAPVDYIPGELAASGDLLALSATFDSEMALDHIQTLSDAAMNGRIAGSEGGWLAGDYIAQQFAAYGLQPAGQDGTFFQSFETTMVVLAEEPTMTIQTADGSTLAGYEPFVDFAPWVRNYAGAGSASGQVIFANNCAHDDFDTIIVIDKIVLCRWGVSSEDEVLNALEHGAAGLMLIPQPGFELDFKYSYKPALVPEPLPTLLVSDGVIEDLLQGSGVSLSELSLTYHPLELGTSLSMNIETVGVAACVTDPCTSRNVLGVLPGRDPEFRHQVIILGAHYDHMGGSPDGTYWPGANDNASGVAVLLEIARSWQAAGYVPRRTVLFAAWDAEELRLLGSQYYVENPQYPLTDTVAQLNFDVVGAGDGRVAVFVGGGLDEQINALAEAVGIPTTPTDVTSSDHASFLGVNVPSGDLAAVGYEETGTLHRTIDTVDTLTPEGLLSVGRLGSLTTMVIADVHPSIEDVLQDRQEAVMQGDLEGLLSTSYGLAQQLDRIWFENLQLLDYSEFEYQLQDLKVEGDQALATISISVTYPSETDQDSDQSAEAEAEIRFVRQESGQWLWDGPNVAVVDSIETSPSNPIISTHPHGEEWTQDMAQTILDRYRQATRMLPFRSTEPLQVVILPMQSALRALIDPTLPHGQTLWSGSNILIRVAGLEDSLDDEAYDLLTARLILLEAGLPDRVPRLVESGLAWVLKEERDQTAVQSEFIPVLSGTLEGQTSSDAGRWAALRYIIERNGWTGLRRFLLALAESCQRSECDQDETLDEAMTASLNLSLEEFNQAWRAFWEDRLAGWQSQIDELLQSRTTAVLEDDQTAFLRTLDGSVANLRQEQQIWFEQLSGYEFDEFILSGEPIALLEDGSLLAEIRLRFEIPDVDTAWSSANLTSISRLTFSAGSLRWAGYPFQQHVAGNILIFHDADEAEQAQNLGEFLQDIYTQTNLAFGLATPPRLNLELYTDPEAFRLHTNSVRPPTDENAAISVSNRVIQLLLPGYSPDSELTPQRSFFTRLFGRQVLIASGVQSELLLKGLTVMTAPNLDQSQRQQYAARKVIRLRYAMRDEGLNFTPQNLPSDEYLLPEELNLAYTYAWDSLTFLVERYGEEALDGLVRGDRQGRELAANFESITGQTLDNFIQEWIDSLWNGYAPDEWVALADSFNSQRAVTIIEELSSSNYAGRLGGSPEALQAAEFIASQFDQLGLIPVGNDAQVETNGPAANGEQPPNALLEPPQDPNPYFQYYTRPFIEMLYQPRVRFSSEFEDGNGFEYRVDYVLPDGFYFNQTEAVSGEIVWVQAYNNSIDLTGKIVLRRLELSLEEEIQLALDHGAIGLIYPGDRDSERDLVAKTILDPATAQPALIPVIELSEDGYIRLLDHLGETGVSMSNKPIVERLGLDVSIEIIFSQIETVWSANVLGLMPGTDPELGQDWIIIGAHYDHVGDDPPAALCPDGVSPPDDSCELQPGIRYPGSNDNASGVALMLEIARVLHESGYQPARSILFVAWGDQEVGELGSTYYAANPVHPLDATISTFHIDAIGDGSGYYLHAFGQSDREATLLHLIENAETVLDGRLQTGIESPQNDHTVFASEGIPTLFLTWKGSNEDNFPTEYADEVQTDRLEKSASMIILTILGVVD